MAENQTQVNSTLNELMAMMQKQNTKLDNIQKDIQTSKDEVKEYVDEKLGNFAKNFEEMEIKLKHQEIICTLEKKILENEITEKREIC